MTVSEPVAAAREPQAVATEADAESEPVVAAEPAATPETETVRDA